MNIPMSQRFWSKVHIGNPDDCWEWQAGRNKDGYGHFFVSPQLRGQRANRVAWELTNGPIPKGLDVLHTCDNPPCCNPAHLFLGTHLDNMHDRDNKGRLVIPDNSGESNGIARLTEPQIIEIRRLYGAKTYNQYQLADMFGVSQVQISRIVNGKRWHNTQTNQ
jgi:hypothetical protein